MLWPGELKREKYEVPTRYNLFGNFWVYTCMSLYFHNQSYSPVNLRKTQNKLQQKNKVAYYLYCTSDSGQISVKVQNVACNLFDTLVNLNLQLRN